MHSQFPALDVNTAMSYIGKTVLMELVWDGATEPFWQCAHIVGIVLPMEGVHQRAYLLAIRVGATLTYPEETYLSDIRTIWEIRHRDRHGSGNVLGRIAHPNLGGSRAALPARRNSSTVPANGSTGAAHP